MQSSPKSSPQRESDTSRTSDGVEMVKGYWIPHVDVRDAEGLQGLHGRDPGGPPQVRRSRAGAGRDMGAAEEGAAPVTSCASFRITRLRSPATARRIQRAKALASHSAADFVIVEGYDGVQPQSASASPAVAARKGYWIAHADVTEPEGYKAYMAADMAPIGKFGGRFLVRGGIVRGGGGPRRARRCSNSRPTRRRSPATARRTINRRLRCARARPNSISSSSMVMTAKRAMMAVSAAMSRTSPVWRILEQVWRTRPRAGRARASHQRISRYALLVISAGRDFCRHGIASPQGLALCRGGRGCLRGRSNPAGSAAHRGGPQSLL